MARELRSLAKLTRDEGNYGDAGKWARKNRAEHLERIAVEYENLGTMGLNVERNSERDLQS